MTRSPSVRRRRNVPRSQPRRGRLSIERLEERRVLANLQILSLTTDNASLAEHNFITGDDRGGIALSNTDVFYTGDGGTGAFPVNSIGSGSPTGYFYDALVSDIGSGAVYSLGISATTPMSYGGGAVTHLIALDGATGAPTGSSVELSSPVTVPFYSGIFAGNAKVVLWDANSGAASAIDTSTGAVTTLGTAFIDMNYTENWARWGVAEEFGGDDYLTYLSGSDVLRTRISDGATSTVASFPAGISDMAAFTVSDALQRWYFHYEGFSGAFGYGSDENIGYADAVIQTGLSVANTSPGQGAVVSSPPTDFAFSFSDDYDPATVDAGDLSVNGIPADSVQQTDAKTLTFHYAISPVAAEGLQTMHMAEGAISSLIDGDPVQEFTGEFFYDTVLLQVAATDPADGSVVPLPATTLDLNFNEAYDFDSVAPSDFTLSQGSVTGIAQVDADTLRLTLSGVVSEGTLNVSMAAGAMTDAFGNAGGAFSASYVLDFDTAPFPAPLDSAAPAGSLIYDSSLTAFISEVGDTDTFTLALDAGQSLTVLVSSADTLQPSVAVYDPGSSLIGDDAAATPGGNALVQTVHLTTPGAYSIAVSGAGGTTGQYTLQVIVNAALEEEAHGAGGNDDLPTAQALDGSGVALGNGADRLAVLGRADGNDDLFAFQLDAGQSATLGLVLPGARLELLDAGGASLAAATSAGNLDQLISNFLATASGTYYARVRGDAGQGDYSLLIARGASFDTEHNDDADHAHELLAEPAGGALGYLSAAPGVVEYNGHYYVLTAGSMLWPDAEAEAVSRGGHLATVNDDAENAFLTATFFTGPTLYDSYWIGLNDYAEEGDFVWSSGEPVTYTNWVPGEPSNSDGIEDGTEINFQAWLGSGRWNDEHNTSFRIGIIELNAPLVVSDWYSVSVNAGDVLSISTQTPADGTGEFVNVLDPAVELYDPSRNLVASDDNSDADGKNASLAYTALESGAYYVRVLPAANTGEYALHVAGATGAPSAFSVTHIDPPDGYSTRFAPTQVTVDFNDSILLTSLSAGDLTVDGLPMTDFTVLDGDTVSFSVPAAAATDGTHTLAIAAGAIHDLQGTPIGAFSSQFSLDLTAPRVVASSIQDAATLPVGNLSYQVTFSEPVAVANVDESDFLLEQLNQSAGHQPTSFNFDPSGTVLTLNYANLSDDEYRLTLYSGDGRLEDVAGWDLDGEALAWPMPPNSSGDGVEGGDFSVQFALDAGEIPLPAEFVAQSPLGSLIYDATVTGVISTTSDLDTYTLRVDPGQSITVILEALDATLRPGAKLYLQEGHDCWEKVGGGTAPAAGGRALIQAVDVPSQLYTPSAPKNYKIVVRGAEGTTGAYRLRVVLNAAAEREDFGGQNNNARARAQSLEDRFLTLDTANPKAQRGAVEGNLRGGPAAGDVYVAVRDYGGSGYVARFDGNGSVAQTIYSPEFDRGYVTDVELGPNNVIYVGLATATSYGSPASGELLKFDLQGNFLGSVQLPDDGIYIGYEYPDGFDVAADGSLWVPQTNSNALVHVGADGATLGSYPLGGLPSDAVVGADGQVYVSLFDWNTYTGKVVQIDPATGLVTDFVPNSGSYDYTQGYLNNAPGGGLWTTDFYNGATRYDATGNWAQHIYASYAMDAQPDPTGNVWVASQYYGIQRYNAAGSYQFGSYVNGYATGLAVAGVDSASPLPEGDFADFYSFGLEKGNSATIALEIVSGIGAGLEIQDAAGNTVALGDNGRVDQFVAPKSGTYYVKVSGSGVHYNLLVTRNADFDQGNNHSLDAAQDLLGTSTNGAQSSGRRSVLGHLESWAGDHYRLKLAAGQTIDGVVRMPAAGAGEFVNLLDPAVRIYGPTGNVVLNVDPTSSRDVSFKYMVPAGGGGIYTIEVYSSANTPEPTGGEYILNLKSLTTPLPAFEVTATNPANGALLGVAPTQIVVDFNDAIQASSLQAGDLLIDGQPAGGVTVIDADTVMFESRPVFEYNGHFYALTSSAKGWLDAEAEAVSLGGHLVTVNDEAENAFLHSKFSRDIHWIGLNDFAEEGNFVWSSGEPVTYTNWSSGEPNNVGDEDAAEINFDASLGPGLWNDRNISTSWFGIVELTTRPAGAWTPTEGPHTLTIAAGAVKDLQGTSLSAYSGSFTLDTTSPTVVGSSIQEGDIVASGDVVYTIEFSEPVQPGYFQYYHAPLIGQLGYFFYPSSFEFNADATALTLYYFGVADDNYTLTVSSSGILDAAGNYLDGEPLAWPIPPNTSGNGQSQGDFFVHFTAVSDPVLAPLPSPLASVRPLGSRVYETPIATAGLIATPDDIDDFTIDLDAGQRLTLAVASQGSWLPVVTLYDPNGILVGTSTATDVGQTVLIQNADVLTAGVYRIEVASAGGTGAYSVRATLNGSLEAEQYGGPANDDLAGAQSLDATFLDLGYGMAQGAVLGTTQDALSDIYSVQLDAGESLTLAVEDRTGAGVSVELLDSLGNLLASSVAGPDNFDQLLANFVAPDTGTYYVRVQGPEGHAYNLVLNRNAAFDIEQNDTQVTAQDLADNRGAVGYLNPPPLNGVIEYNGHFYFLTSTAMLWPDAEAEAASFGGHLATINDADEDFFLMSAFNFSFFWIGFNDLAEEGNFVWTSGEPVTYTNWYFAEPNDCCAGEDVTVTNWGGAWNDYGIDGVFYGIIELDAPLVEEADWYNVTVQEGEALSLNANASATGPGEFVNDLVPRIALYDAHGNELATAEGAGASLTSDALAAGVYSVRVAASGLGALGGEYTLGVTRVPAMTAGNAGVRSFAADQAVLNLATPAVSGRVTKPVLASAPKVPEDARFTTERRLREAREDWDGALAEWTASREYAQRNREFSDARASVADLLFAADDDWRYGPF